LPQVLISYFEYPDVELEKGLFKAAGIETRGFHHGKDVDISGLAAEMDGLLVQYVQVNWEDLATFFDYPAEIRRLIYTTNTLEGYHRQLRKVTKNKASFPTPEAIRKLLYLATQDVTRKWTSPIQNWANILNQLAIRFEGRVPI
jgi:hypothetical protein